MAARLMETRLPLVDVAAQHRQLDAPISAAIDRVFKSSQFILGPEVAAFEAEFAEFCEVEHVVGCGNGTDALELALAAVGVKAGDEVITVAHTFAATAEAIVRSGATPRFVDVRPDTLLMDVDAVEAAITPRTSAIVPVHLRGACVDMPAILDIAARHGLQVIEDAAQAHGARLGGRRAGSFGAAATFSFYPGKNLGACGDAGAVTTNDASVAENIRAARDHGRMGKYEHASVGRNSRMDALQAAILRVKLPHLDGWNARRRSLAAGYDSLFADAGVRVVGSPPGGDAVHHLYVVRVAHRDTVRSSLAADGIATGVHYPIPLHRQRAFAPTAAEVQVLPVTETAADDIMTVPMYPGLEWADLERVVTAVASAVGAP